MKTAQFNSEDWLSAKADDDEGDDRLQKICHEYNFNLIHDGNMGTFQSNTMELGSIKQSQFYYARQHRGLEGLGHSNISGA